MSVHAPSPHLHPARHGMTAPEPGFGRYEAAVGSDAPLERLEAHALAAVAAVVPVTLAWCLGVGRRHALLRAVVMQSGRFDLEPASEWRRYLAQPAGTDPFTSVRVEARDATVLSLKDFDPGESEALRRHLADRRLADRADVYLRDAGTIVAQFALIRSEELGRFSSADLSALRRLQPLLEQAFAHALAPQDGDAHGALVEEGLSEREAEVAEMVGRGATNAEIARSLHIGEATVKTHLTRVHGKLGVGSRTQLALLVGARQARAGTTSG